MGIAAMKLLAFACASLAFASDGCENDGSYPWKNKPNYCTDVTMYQTRTNSWVCRNCFNIRLEFNLGWIGAVGYWWDNRDSIYFAFKDPVSAIKAAGPALTPVAIPDKDGLYRYRMDFNKQAQFGDGRIDINVEFNDNDTDGELAWVYTCPCGTGTKKDKEPTPTDAPEDDDEEPVTDAPEDDDDDEEPVTDAPEDDQVKPDGCDPKGIDFPEPPAEGGFWNCGWHRKGPVQQRMNRCHWECFGEDPVEDSGLEPENSENCSHGKSVVTRIIKWRKFHAILNMLKRRRQRRHEEVVIKLNFLIYSGNISSYE